MLRLSTVVVGILNFAAVLLSIPVLVGGLWLRSKASTDCERFFDTPLIALGAFLLIVSLFGLVGACCRNCLLLCIYLFVMFLLIVLLFAFTIFAFFITNKGAGQVVSDRGFKEYRLGDYSHWIQKRVSKPENWMKIRSCLQDSKVCQSMVGRVDQQASQFYAPSSCRLWLAQNLSPIQSGCCKPPLSCNYTYVTPINWTKTPTNSTDPDCVTWSNEPSTLCYDCSSCKGGVAANLKQHWKKVAEANLIFLMIVLVLYSVGCCAFRNN